MGHADRTRAFEREDKQEPANVRLWRAWLASPPGTRVVDLAKDFGMTKSQATGAIWRRKTGRY